MLIYKTGDLLNATENIIAHQCNVNGIFGGGLALQIAKSYPNVEEKYKQYCKDNSNCYEVLRGESYIVDINEKQQIANCFTQEPNFDANYQDIYECFTTLLMLCKQNNKTICLPKNYGCGIANGEWLIVENILKELSNIYDIDIVIYEQEGK